MANMKWKPPVDLYVTPTGWAVKLDAAGVRPEDVDVELDGQNLRISGVRRDVFVRDGWRHYSMEIEYNRFERVVRLPQAVRKVLLSQEMRDGMLVIQVKPQDREN